MDPKSWPAFSLVPPNLLSKIKAACVFGTLGTESIFVTSDDEVYGTGTTISGCLGADEHHSCIESRLIKPLCGKRIKNFAYGGGPCVLVVTETGDVYTWGHNGYCELNSAVTPALIVGGLHGRMVIEVACGNSHNLALCDNGEVYAWGQNACGQVGSGLTTNQNSPRKVTLGIGDKFITSIACSNTSSFAITDCGEVYAWGYNGTGVLGIGNTSNQLSPVRLMSNMSGVVIVKLMCGNSHALALSDDGVLYSWGSNCYGQLGHSNKSNALYPLKLPDSIGRIVDIAAVHYNNTSAAMTQDLKVFMWGQCRGQNVSTPVLTPFKSLHDVFLNFCSPSVTYKSLVPTLAEMETVADTIKNAFDDPTTSDLTIVVEDKPIYVHKIILKLRCEHFRTMFQEHWPESNQTILNIDRSSYPVYKAFLQHLYTDEVKLAPELALELLDLATSYCETALKSRCEEIIKHGITIQNAATLYSAAITFQAKSLEDFCFTFALGHMTAITQTAGFLDLDEITTKEFIVKASRHGAFKN